ncbi:unnamed protein product [Schistosoma bovis]|nr:unnamed protein product [Schistosoma bovis]CAH8669491.1 unnamed protein product [Schistosoma bovis]CAH8674324.1 unnamed protein product [Schistosoma haematobium]CAH8678211.1 unnamed protein product [Schistosoma haematobium]
MENTKPTGMRRASHWSTEVENAYRFQLAGYRDEVEYFNYNNADPEKWTNTGFVKKLKRRDGLFYYFNKNRECPDKDIPKCKLYVY